MTTRIQAPRRADDDRRGRPLGFGVLAPSSTVARLAVVPAIDETPNAEVVRTASGAAGESYDDVLADPAVEAVYVPLPNGLHREWVERAAAAGKHVLCEKPLALTGDDAQAMVDACDAAGVVLMEAYMTPFHPRTIAFLELVRAGRIGRPRSARAAFTSVLDRPDDHRWDPALGGGALADVGVYVLTPLFDVAEMLGTPVPAAVHATATLTDAGVDSSCAGQLTFPGGFHATFECSFEVPTRQLLEVTGTDGRLVVDHETFTAGPADTTIEHWDAGGDKQPLFSPGGNAYRGMVDHFCAAVRGRSELRRPPAMAVAFARFCDNLRATWT